MRSVYPAGKMSVRRAAVALMAVDRTQRHIGVLYEDVEAKAVLFLHLAFHLDLQLMEPPNGGLWIDPTFPTERLEQVAAICRRIWNRNQSRIPFGFSRPNDCFDHDTYAFLIGPTQRGLTCATFVLAIFLEAGLKMVDYDSWPIRADDVVWQHKVIELLRKRAVAPGYIEAVRQSMADGAARIRPEEVAAAAIVTPQPATFAPVRLRASKILWFLYYRWWFTRGAKLLADSWHRFLDKFGR